MPAPKEAPYGDVKSFDLDIDAQNGSCSSITVKPGDKVQWTAPSTSNAYVIPPDIFAACKNAIAIPAGETLPNPPCVVTGQDGSYAYTSGLGNPPTLGGVATGNNDTITVDTSTKP
jgi:hypothetical protein